MKGWPTHTPQTMNSSISPKSQAQMGHLFDVDHFRRALIEAIPTSSADSVFTIWWKIKGNDSAPRDRGRQSAGIWVSRRKIQLWKGSQWLLMFPWGCGWLLAGSSSPNGWNRSIWTQSRTLFRGTAWKSHHTSLPCWVGSVFVLDWAGPLRALHWDWFRSGFPSRSSWCSWRDRASLWNPHTLMHSWRRFSVFHWQKEKGRWGWM